MSAERELVRTYQEQLLAGTYEYVLAPARRRAPARENS